MESDKSKNANKLTYDIEIISHLSLKVHIYVAK